MSQTHSVSDFELNSLHGIGTAAMPPMQNISTSITNSSRKNIKSGWILTVDVKENCTTPHIILNLMQYIISDTFKQWMSWSHPFKCGIIFQKCFVKNYLFIF